MEQSEKIAYIGGLMDGDGSFSIMRRDEKKGGSLLYFPFIQYGSLSKESVDFVKETFGGSVILQKAHIKKDKSSRRDFYHWRLSNRESCITMIDSLSPYMEIKKERAEFLKEFILKNPFKRGSNRLSQEVLISRENDYLQMKKFNDERRLDRNLVKQSKSLTEDKLFWCYFAGLLDTDGSFSIKKEKNGKFSALVLLTMTDVRGINKIRKNTFFGTVFKTKAISTQRGKCYRFGIYRRDEISLLLSYIIPYLRTKKEQAMVLQDFCDNLTTVKHRRSGMPQVERDFRESCYQKIILLNKYGVLKPTLIDLEARQGDKAEGENHGERLSEMAAKADAIV